jgi:hypothetical protein
VFLIQANRLSKSIGILSKSIGILVTRVENDGITDEEMTNISKAKLFEILNDEKRRKLLTKKTKRCYSIK